MNDNKMETPQNSKVASSATSSGDAIFGIPLSNFPIDLNAYPYAENECKAIIESAQVLADKVSFGGLLGVVIGAALTYPKRFSKSYKLWTSVTGFCAGSVFGNAYGWTQIKPKLNEVQTPLTRYVLTKQIPLQIIVPVIRQKYPNGFNTSTTNIKATTTANTDVATSESSSFESDESLIDPPSKANWSRFDDDPLVTLSDQQSSKPDTVVARAQRRKERMDNMLTESRQREYGRKRRRRRNDEKKDDSDDDLVFEHDIKDMHNDFDYGDSSKLISEADDEAEIIADKYS